MKKLLALLLAALMALSCTLALAETAEVDEIPEFQMPGITLASELDIDREVLNNALVAFNVDEDSIALIDTVAAVLTEASEQVIFADNGLQYDLFLKDKDILNLAGELTDDGVAVATSLLPSYVLTLSNESIAKLVELVSSQLQGAADTSGLDINALAESVMGYVQTYMASCVNAVTFGDTEMGTFEINGLTYNAKTPINVDIPAIMEAATAMTQAIANDEAVQAAIQAAQANGMDVSLDAPEAEAVDPATLPELTMDAYMTVDAEGNMGDTTDVVFTVTVPGSDDPVTTGDVLVEGNAVTVNVDFITADTTAVVTVLPQDAGLAVRLDVYASGIYAGLSFLGGMEDALTCQFDVFLLDREKPLLTEVATLYLDGERTLVVNDPAKTVYALDDLVNGGDPEDLATTLGLDLVLKGLTGLLSDATQAMPEEFAPIANMITGALFGGASAQE